MVTNVRRVVLALLLVCVGAVAGSAQTPATYADRARLATDSVFVGRVTVAALVSAIAVVLEAPDVPDRAVRVKLAGYVLREPEFVARRLAPLLAATAPATVDEAGVPSSSLSDSQMLTTIAARWTVIAHALVGGQ